MYLPIGEKMRSITVLFYIEGKANNECKERGPREVDESPAEVDPWN
jgi:hypothetical protein